ncbi:MAG: hypothetical protein V3W41_21940 [Planctomycetota bacterium]
MKRYTGKGIEVRLSPRIDRQANTILAFAFLLSLDGCNRIELRPEEMTAQVLLTEGDDADAIGMAIGEALDPYASGPVGVDLVDVSQEAAKQ